MLYAWQKQMLCIVLEFFIERREFFGLSVWTRAEPSMILTSTLGTESIVGTVTVDSKQVISSDFLLLFMIPFVANDGGQA